MGSADITFDAMVGGVTQTPESLRTGDKLASQVNCIANLVEGLRRRPHTNHLGNMLGLPSVTVGSPAFHFIDRGDERYVVAVGDRSQSGDGTMAVYDVLSGVSSVVIRDKNGDPAVADDFDYLDCEDPAIDLRLRTLADVTWVLNRRKVAAMTSTVSPDWTPQALFVIVTGGYSSTYKLTVETRTVTMTTNSAKTAGNEEWVTPGYIAERMAAALTGSPTANNAADGALVLPAGTALLPAEWNIEVHGGVVYIERVNGADFTITTEDSFTTRAIVVKDTVAAFTELPAVAPDGFNIKVDGDDDLEGGEYYLTFVADNSGEFGPGDWTQTVAPGLEVEIDPDTMPHLLVRLSNGEFLFTPADGTAYSAGGVTYDIPKWTDREVGDELSNPKPGFIGNTIKEVLFTANRFTLIGDQFNSISTQNEPYTFWRLTVRELLDTTRIDLIMPHDRVVSLHSAVAISGQLYSIGTGTQFRVSGNDVLSPKDVSTSVMSEFSTDPNVRAISIGNSIFAADRRGAFSVVREFYDPQAQRPALKDAGLMDDLPAFIVGQIRSLSGSDTLSMLAVTSIGNPTSFYTANLIEREGRRVINSWAEHTSSGEVVLAEFIGTDLFILVKRGAAYSLECADTTPFATDDGKEYAVALDRRTSVTPTAMDGGSTVINLPYTVAGEMFAISADGDSPQVTYSSGSTIKVLGDFIGVEMLVGERFESSFEPSRAYVRMQSQTGGTRNAHAQWLAITSGSVTLEDTGHLLIKTTVGDDEYVDEFTPTLLDGSVAGGLELFSGEYEFDIFADSDIYRITFHSDSSLPFRVMSLKLSLQWRQGRQML